MPATHIIAPRPLRAGRVAEIGTIVKVNLNEKQKKIINTWLDQSKDMDDPYSKFIALWISFNAYCYALYAKTARLKRANLKHPSKLDDVTFTEGSSRVEGTLELNGARFELNIDQPVVIQINISERYSENLIFSRFASEYKSEYARLLDEDEFASFVKEFRLSLGKNGEFYVIDMAQYDRYQEHGNLACQEANEIIVRLKDHARLGKLIKALYQVRCNVFHGEKTPSDRNDDRIVKKAYPVLLRIMDSLSSGFTVQSERVSIAR